jgi:recombination protein RecA
MAANRPSKDRALPNGGDSKDKALDLALAQIEKQFGRGSIMKLGENPQVAVDVISTGSLGLDMALGIGGLPKGRIVEIYGPESSGKCLTADTYIWTDRGLETVAEVFARCGQVASCTARVTDVTDFGVRAVNEAGNLEQIAALTHNNRRPVLQFRLKSGRTITVTHNHPLRVVDENGFIVWREAGEIEQGDTMVSALFGAVEATSGDGLSEDEAVFIGYLVAEGTLGQQNSIRFTNWDPEVGADFTQLAQFLLNAEVRCYDLKEYAIYSKNLRTEIAERYGLDYVNADGKKVPYCVRTAGHKVQRAFLAALYEGDGWIDGSSTIGFCSASEQLARDVQLLLYGLGIPATVSPKFNPEYQRDYWNVTINPSVAHRFIEEVGFRSARRRTQVEKNFRRSARDPQFENIPNVKKLVLALRDDLRGNRGFDRVAGDLFRADLNLNCSRSRLARIVEWVEGRANLTPTGRAIVSYLRDLAQGRYTFEPVDSVEDLGRQPTFDLVMPETHSFLANGVLSHNTSLCLHVVAETQKQGGIAAFIDAEHALDVGYARNLGVNADELLVSQPDTGEQALEIADMLVRSNAVDLIVIDSVAALTPRAEIEGEMGDTHIGLQARLMSQALRKLAGNVARSNTLIIFINQLREKIGVMFGSPETTPGGRALKFYSSVRLDIRKIENLKDGAEVVGSRVRVKVVKSKVSAPFRQTEFDVMYGHGISKEGSLIDTALDRGIVSRSGAWYLYEGDQLGQGRENAKAFMAEHPDVYAEIERKVKEAVGLSAAEDPPGEKQEEGDESELPA